MRTSAAPGAPTGRKQGASSQQESGQGVPKQGTGQATGQGVPKQGTGQATELAPLLLEMESEPLLEPESTPLLELQLELLPELRELQLATGPAPLLESRELLLELRELQLGSLRELLRDFREKTPLQRARP